MKVEYAIEDLFKNDREPPPNLSSNTGPSILKAEMEKALNKGKNNKASGPHQICTEWLKLLSNDNIRELTILFNQIYDTNEIPLFVSPRNQTLKNAAIADSSRH